MCMRNINTMWSMWTIKTMQRTSIMQSIGRINSTHGIETICDISKSTHKKLILHGVSGVSGVSEASVLCIILGLSLLLQKK